MKLKDSTDQQARLRLDIRGAVQGVGFRPFVHRLANAFALAGWVNNSPQGVLIEVEGARPLLERFLAELEDERPPRCSIRSLQTMWLTATGYRCFEIRDSKHGGDRSALILPDMATCSDCLREIFDPADRRHRYPFTNCTNCGPRFSIIEALPYDRANTSMREFEMCAECRAEYNNPCNRRFHAQPNACPGCGPRLELWEGVRTAEPLPLPHRLASGDDALCAAARAIAAGEIAAVKGLGGFHLIVAAHDAGAVRQLRERKHREEKPLALMFPSMAMARECCEISAAEERLLCSPEAPIVLLRRRSQSQISDLKVQIADAVAPGNPNLGVMLPSNPVHHLLMAELGFPVVATSGNLSEEPICTDEIDALHRLGGIADLFLVHNRPIVRHVDDSVARVMLGRESVLRCARGYAPMAVALDSTGVQSGPDSILAVGAHLKNSVALKVGEQAFLSQHIGDLETERAHFAFRRVIADFERLYEVEPGTVAADPHSDYLSTRFADEMVRRVPTTNSGNHPASATRRAARSQIQHHVAHVLSCMAENGLRPPVLGVAWDGTGLGDDGTVWGGEFFLVSERNVRRAAHLLPFRLPGREAAVREPRRSALGLLYGLSRANLFDRSDLPAVADFAAVELATLRIMLERGVNAPFTSSIGRLFDAVAAITGLCQRNAFEGQAAMALEFAAETAPTESAYSLPVVTGESSGAQIGTLVLDWRPMIEALLDDVREGIGAGLISAKFHNSLVEAVVNVARAMEQPCVALSGGCFQNRLLTERVVHRLRAEGFQPYWHQRVPPNDGGLALGQIVGALRERGKD